jgi:hypothetical protein
MLMKMLTTLLVTMPALQGADPEKAKLNIVYIGIYALPFEEGKSPPLGYDIYKSGRLAPTDLIAAYTSDEIKKDFRKHYIDKKAKYVTLRIMNPDETTIKTLNSALDLFRKELPKDYSLTILITEIEE